MADGEVNLGLGQSNSMKPPVLGDKPAVPPPLLIDPPPVSQESPDVVLHRQATEAYERLILQPELEPLCAQYSATLQAADFQEVQKAFELVKGAGQIALVARGNFQKQTDRLLLAAEEIRMKGKVVTFTFGEARAFQSLEEVEQAFREIQFDMEQVKRRIEVFLSSDKKQDIEIDLLHLLEKYMFDGKNLEKEQAKKVHTLIIKDPQHPKFIDTLKRAQILADSEEVEDGDVEPIQFQKNNTGTVLLPTDRTQYGVIKKMELWLAGDRESGNFFLTFGEIPQTVILHIPSQDSFRTNITAYLHLLVDYMRLPYKDRPRVIAYTDGFTPDAQTRRDYQGFLFCNTEDEL